MRYGMLEISQFFFFFDSGPKNFNGSVHELINLIYCKGNVRASDREILQDTICKVLDHALDHLQI